MSFLFFTFVKLAILFGPLLVLVLCHAAKRGNIVSSFFFFISVLCVTPLWYAQRRYTVIWHQLDKIEVFGVTLDWYIFIEIICLILGILFLFLIKNKTDSEAEFDHFVAAYKAEQDAKKADHNKPPTTWNQTTPPPTNRPNG